MPATTMISTTSLFLANIAIIRGHSHSLFHPICIRVGYINAKYEYYSWNNELNGPIYYDHVSNMYLYPWRVANDDIQYLVQYDYTKYTRPYAYCTITSSKSSAGLISPYDCYHDGIIQLNYFVYQWQFIDDLPSSMLPCSGINTLHIHHFDSLSL